MGLEFSCMRFSGTSASITCRFLLTTYKLWGKKKPFFMCLEQAQLPLTRASRTEGIAQPGPNTSLPLVGVFLGGNERFAALILKSSIGVSVHSQPGRWPPPLIS